MASKNVKSSNVQSLLMNAKMLPALYKQHFGKDWDTNEPMINCAKALAQKGVTINRRGSSVSGNGTGINIDSRKKPESAIRGVIRDMAKSVWESGQESKTINGNGKTLTVNTVLSGNNGYTMTIMQDGEALETHDDYADCYHRLFELFDI